MAAEFDKIDRWQLRFGSKGLDANYDHHFQRKLIVTCSHYGLQFVVSLIIGIILVDPSGLNIVSKSVETFFF